MHWIATDRAQSYASSVFALLAEYMLLAFSIFVLGYLVTWHVEGQINFMVERVEVPPHEPCEDCIFSLCETAIISLR